MEKIMEDFIEANLTDLIEIYIEETWVTPFTTDTMEHFKEFCELNFDPTKPLRTTEVDFELE